MTAMRFVDTNVLLYAVSRDPEEHTKAEIARRLLCEDDLAMSVQVLQEFYVQATRPTRPDRLSHRKACSLIEGFLRFPVHENTIAVMQSALKIREHAGISYWDASIVAAASSLGCTALLSEDLNNGREIGGVQIWNPFQA